jgi:cytochrome c-type biogenesis protein CcmH/NrfF
MNKLFLSLLIFTGIAQAVLPDAGLSRADEARYHRLCQQLIAPCCWSQPVETHLSPAADRARVEVAAMIRAGKTDRQILDSFIARYGERILAEPEGIKSVVLTTVPIVALLSGFAALILFLSRRRRAGLAMPQRYENLLPELDWD